MTAGSDGDREVFRAGAVVRPELPDRPTKDTSILTELPDHLPKVHPICVPKVRWTFRETFNVKQVCLGGYILHEFSWEPFVTTVAFLFLGYNNN